MTALAPEVPSDRTNQATPRDQRVVLIGCGLALLLIIAAFMTYDLRGSLSYALELRARKVLVMALVGTALSSAAVLFHTVSGNRILTPAIIGLDSLYILIQTVAAFLLGALTYAAIDERLRFVVAVGLMMALAIGLNTVFLRRAADDLPLLILSGVVLGGVFGSLSALAARLIDPNEFNALQDQLFANFSTVNEELLAWSAVVISAAFGVAFRQGRTLDVLALGRPTATSLGVDVERTTKLVLVLVAALVAVPTALVGPVTFLGLLAAHFAYEITGTSRHRATLPVAAMMATITLVGAQFIIEELFDFNTRVSVVLAFIGGIAFLFLLLRDSGDTQPS